MSHLHQDKKILNRIKRIQGQVTSVEKSLLTPESSCLEVLQQVAAIKGAVNGLMQQLLEQHLREHVLKGDQKDRKSTRLNSSHSQQSRMPSSA